VGTARTERKRERLIETAMRKLVLFGDSITAGRIGIAYRNTLPLPAEVHGIEGDTWTGTLQRVLRYVQTKRPGKEKTVVIQSGANDLLLPEMGRRYEAWSQTVNQIMGTRNRPLENLQEFVDACSNDLNTLLTNSTSCSFLICSIPILGENLNSPLNQKRIERNRLLKEIVEHVPNSILCDITTPIEYLVNEKQGNSSYLPEHPGNLQEDAQFIGTDERRAAQLSLSRGLIATIDGIHPNGIGAQTIGSAIANQLPW